MKNSLCLYVVSLLILTCVGFSCKQKDLNRNAYDLNRDTIAPVLSITVPVNLDTYSYGEDIHIVGTATDLESKNSIRQNPGKLKSLSLNISILDPISGNVTKVLLQKNPNVDGKQGYTINEKTYLVAGTGTTTCRFTGVTTDYADRKDSSVVYFTIN